MFPVVIDLTRISVLLIGQGEVLTKRQKQLEEAGASQLTVVEGFSVESGAIERATVVMVAGLPREQSEMIVRQARALGKLINAEDITDLCDFYFTAHVRRGDLLIAVSTGGASPTLAKRVRDVISERFGAEWTERVHVLADLRNSLKKSGASMKEIMEKTERFLAEKGWLV